MQILPRSDKDFDGNFLRQRFCKLNRYSLPGEIVSECARKKKSSYQRILVNCCQQSPTKRTKEEAAKEEEGGQPTKVMWCWFNILSSWF